MNQAEEIRRACNILFRPGQVVELRAVRRRGIASGYFTDLAELAKKAVMLESDPEYLGMYVTLNEVNPDLFSRRANRIETRMGNRESTTADADIIRRRWFPVDIDPKRLSGISSSDAEHEAARRTAEQIRSFLSELGWPLPLLADSGNGYHLLYPIDLPNDEESSLLIRNALAALSFLFSDEQAEIDTAVSNPARIWKLYGTLSRKGDNTPLRPHRRSAIIDWPEEGGIVPVSELMHLSSRGEKRDPHPSSAGQKEHLDLGSWLERHGLACRERPYPGGRLFVFGECPFSSAHKDGAYAIQFENGAIFAGCHHTSCGGGKQRWQELRGRYDPPGRKNRPGQERPERDYSAEERKNATNRDGRADGSSGDRKTGKTPDPAGETDDTGSDSRKREEIAREADRILREGNPFEYVVRTFGLDHEGDETVSHCLAMSLASRSVINSNGLHVLVTGESGKGKSHAFDTMLGQVPEESRLDGRMSDKALFYTESLLPGSVISLDDVSLSDQMQEILKGVTTSFRRPFLYRTVDKDRRGQVRYIPERCVWWVAKMEGTGDGQVWNRMLTCWIDDSRDQDNRVLARELARASGMPESGPVRQEIQVCREIWRSLAEIWVIIPYAERIRFTSTENRRNPGMLLDIIRAHAALMQHQRPHREYNGKTCILATEEDFRVASRLYGRLNSESGGQISKLTRSEAELVTAISRMGKPEIRISEMQYCTGRSYSHIYKMLHGYLSRGTTYSGLLEKCPALSYHQRTDATEGGGVSRSMRVYCWDVQLYTSWKEGGGGCWLDDPGDDGGRLRKDGGGSRQEKDEGNASETDNTSNNTLVSTSMRKNGDARGGSSGVPVHTGDPAVSATCSQLFDSESISPPDGESEEGYKEGRPRHPASVQPDLQPEIPVQQPGIDTRPITLRPGFSGIPLERIHPAAFRRTEGTEPGPCDVCGSRTVQYREKVSPEMRRRNRSPRRICQRCYTRAVAREVRSFHALPGILDISRMKRTTGYGRCHLCHLQETAWWDPVSRTGLCNTCFYREAGAAEEARP